VAESEASREARLDDTVDNPVDTDQLAVGQPVDDGAPEATGEFGYLFDEPEYIDPVAEFDDQSEVAFEREDEPAAEWVAPPPLDPTEHPFDAFNAGTWNFKPATVPWYRTRSAIVALVAASLAVVALVVSVVLLAFRGSSGDEKVPAPTETSTAPTTETVPVITSELPPPPPPPPPSPPPPPPLPPSASEIERAPVIIPRQPTNTKKPEFNVTRSPLSVSPQMPKRR
jgi:hypothetical protein